MKDHQQYIYNLSEEFMVGILLVVQYSDDINFYFNDVMESRAVVSRIQLRSIIGNYLNKQIKRRFSALTEYGAISFNTLDLIQGIITGASWINLDPHNYIKEIRDNGVLITF